MKKVGLFVGLLGYVFVPIPVFADALGCVHNLPGYPDVQSLGCLADVIISVINKLFIFLGAVAILYLLYGSIRFITSRGDPKAIEGAQKTMTYAVIGVVIILGSYIIVNIITNALGLGSILDKFTLFQQ